MHFSYFFLFIIFFLQKYFALPNLLKCLGNDNIFQNYIGFNNLSFANFEQ